MEIAGVGMPWPGKIHVPPDEGFERRDQGRRTNCRNPDAGSAGRPRRLLPRPPARRTVRTPGATCGPLPHSAPFPLNLAFPANPDHRSSSSYTVRTDGRALGEASSVSSRMRRVVFQTAASAPHLPAITAVLLIRSSISTSTASVRPRHIRRRCVISSCARIFAAERPVQRQTRQPLDVAML